MPHAFSKALVGIGDLALEAWYLLAGGHSIDSTDPVFVLSVNGIIPVVRIKKYNGGKPSDLLFLTKPLRSGILSTARKRGLLQSEHNEPLLKNMGTLNSFGEQVGTMSGVHALTDVTGFELLGHVSEIANGSGCGVELYYDRIPQLPGVAGYIQQRIFPDYTTRNWSRYQSDIKFEKGVPVAEAFTLLPDPQTNGGLLIAVSDGKKDELIGKLKEAGLTDHLQPIGRLTELGEKRIVIGRAV